MPKKKSVAAKKSPAKKSSTAARAGSKPEISHIESRLRKSNRSLAYSFVVFIISLILYLVTYKFIESFFGFVMIVSGALVILFGVISIILYIVKGRR
jgi:dolichol kinase